MATYEQLAERYRHLGEVTERERALIEKEMLDAATTEGLRGNGEEKTRWFAQRFGGTEYAVEHRQRLLAFGEIARPLWKRVDADMTLRTAVQLMRDAHARASVDGCNMSTALERCIVEYDALPNLCRLPDGKIIRKRGLTSLDRELPKKPRHAIVVPSVNEDTKEFWAGIRQMLGDHFRVRLDGLDSMAIDHALRSLEVDLKVLLETHMNRVDRLRRGHSTRTMMASRGKIVAAYRALNLDPPKPNGPIDIKRVKKQYKQLARRYHTDTTGDESTRPAYEAVIEAYRIIEDAHEAKKA